MKECPKKTKDYNNYICKDIFLNRCILIESHLSYLGKNITDNDIEKIIKKYINEFNYTNNHVSIYKNDIYSITIYKNGECISELSLEIIEIDFNECYKKIKQNYNITDNLIIAIVYKKINTINSKKVFFSFSLFNPGNGDNLLLGNICKNEAIFIKEKLLNKLNETNININSILYLAKNNIGAFNLSSALYVEICYDFDSPIKKDVSLKD